ncbi:hypothetical protein ACQEU5_25160 [Marinactinospora thermotolerans]|uniref:hypothetical protein n=1 Tax=Marinactinospora thermotolerans TaxID=531310 RepID=UPI003D90768A
MSETPPATELLPVRFVGGPDDWHDCTLDMCTAEQLAGPREDIGAYLISDCVPADHPDPGARAVYEPDDAPARADVWYFRGWMPSAPTAAELRRAPVHEPLAVDGLDQDGAPTGWTAPAGVAHSVERVLAHWQGEDGGPDVWHARVLSAGGVGDWELHRHGDGRWTGGPMA